jgi:transposase
MLKTVIPPGKQEKQGILVRIAMVHHPKKFVSPLSGEETARLEKLMKEDRSARVRMRAHSILLSDRNMGIDVIAAFYNVSRDTVSNWIDRWERKGLHGLRDRPRCGAPRTITEAERRLIRALVNRYPRSNREVIKTFAARTGKTISESTIRRIVKQDVRHP